MPPHIRYVYIWLTSVYLCAHISGVSSHFLQCTSSYDICNPSTQDWSLELEEVFSLEREGEFDKYAPYRDKVGNRMLLWHGKFWY
jgi:hypothetical protein